MHEDAVGGPPMRFLRVRQLTPQLETASAKKDSREVCCLPGAQVRVISRKLPCLVHPSDCYPLVTVEAGSNGVADRSLRTNKKDFRGQGCLVEGACIFHYPFSGRGLEGILKGAGKPISYICG